MSKDKYNRKDYSAYWFSLLLVLAAAYLILKDLGILTI